MTRLAGPAARLVGALAILIVLTAGHAAACAICLSAVSVTPGQQLDAADQVVLAMPAPDGQQFRVVAAIKGDLEAGAVFPAPGFAEQPAALAMSFDAPIAGQVPDRTSGDKPLLLLRNSLSERWSSLGAIAAEHADWLRRLTESNRDGATESGGLWPVTAVSWSTLSDEAWAERTVLIAPYLESDEPLAAEIAFGELTRAPYGAMLSLKPSLDVAKIRAWIEDPELAARRSAYLLLLGIVGGPGDAAMLEQRIAAARAANDATDLSAMLAADLELRGPSRVDWIERAYFADGDRALPEIAAALLALSVHGSADGTVPRQRVVDAYRLFIRERPAMAAFVAKDLADWQARDAVPDYLDVVRSGAVKDPSGRFAIVAYLRQISDDAADAALAEFGGTAE